MPELSRFTAVDWAVVAGILVLTTLVGSLLGRHATMRDFFLGGRRLPWWVVSASIIATEISAVTLVAIPWVVYRPGGDITSLQVLAIGSILARFAIAWKLVPVYFAREVYSPYDVLGERLGEGARRVASCLFVAGNVLGQSARVYLMALVIEVVLHEDLASLEARTGVPSLVMSIGVVSLFAIFWTWIGGVATVAWTDLILLGVILVAVISMLVVIAGGLDLGFERIWRVGVDSHRFRFLDFDTSPGRAYTFWAAAIASSFGNIGAYGVDQMVAQRLLCCRDARDARKAIVASSLAMVVTFLVSLVGVGLCAWYERHPMSTAGTALVESGDDRIVPVFALEYMPEGLRGLVIAGILAAAISTLTAALGALSQSTLSALWQPLARRIRRARGIVLDAAGLDRASLRASRGLVVVFGLLLGTIAVLLQPVARSYGSVLDLALSLPGYTQGALLAGILLAITRAPIDGSGYVWSAPLSAFWVFCCAWHGPRTEFLVPPFVFAAFVAWLCLRAWPDLRDGAGIGRVAFQSAMLTAGLGLCAWVAYHGEFWWQPVASEPGRWTSLAFPWYVPAGCVFAFVLGHVLARTREPERAVDRAADATG